MPQCKRPRRDVLGACRLCHRPKHKIQSTSCCFARAAGCESHPPRRTANSCGAIPCRPAPPGTHERHDWQCKRTFSVSTVSVGRAGPCIGCSAPCKDTDHGTTPAWCMGAAPITPKVVIRLVSNHSWCSRTSPLPHARVVGMVESVIFCLLETAQKCDLSPCRLCSPHLCSQTQLLLPNSIPHCKLPSPNRPELAAQARKVSCLHRAPCPALAVSATALQLHLRPAIAL